MKAKFEKKPKRQQVRLEKEMLSPEIVLQEVKTKINDLEVFDEVKQKFDFSSDKHFVDSFINNYQSNEQTSTIFTDSIFGDRIEKLSAAQIYTIAPETIVLKFGRPSLLIQKDQFEEPESDVWKGRLNSFKNHIAESIPSVGRIELVNHSTYDWIGTGWLYKDSDLIITNRHVAEVFMTNVSGSFEFKKNLEGKTIKSYIDFKEEFRIDQEASFKIKEAVYIAPNDKPDVAILRVYTTNEDNQSLSRGLTIAQDIPAQDSVVYSIGYPAKDSRIIDSSLMERIFRNIYNVKRLSPGKLTDTTNYVDQYHHDCSTLGGFSGAPVISLETGEVVGLHHAGTYRKYNWAVQSQYLTNLIYKYL